MTRTAGEQAQQQELYNVTLKTSEEIERDEVLQMAYKRGYEDGCASHTSAPAAEAQQRVIKELEAMRDRNDRKGNTEHLNFHDGVVHACEQAIALLQAGRK